MKHSEQINELVGALALAQAKYLSIGKDKRAEVRSDKGAFSYAYADLASAIEATRPALTENGIAVTQPTRMEGPTVIVTTLLAHKSGQWISEEMSWPAGADTRARGSAVTYARRHGYLSMIGAAAQDDDDAAAADGQRGTERRGRQPQRQATPNADARAAVQRSQPAPMPSTPEARAANLKTRLAKLGVKPGAMAEKLGGWISRPIDDTGHFSGDDWMRANEGLKEMEATAATLGHAQARANGSMDQRNP
jgi:hypothetical protein